MVIAENTRKLLGNLFEFEDLGAKDLKGIAEPVGAWAALRTSTVESRFEALRVATTPLVGRDEEMALLARRWEQAKSGEGQIVLISGEPGIGKSRLAQTMVERLAGEPHIRLRFFCSPHHQDSALYPVIAHLERAAGFRREDTTEQQLDKPEALLAQATNDLDAVARLFADLLSAPTRERYPPLDLTPQKRKEKTLAALVAQVEGLSAREPLLMVYEDIPLERSNHARSRSTYWSSAFLTTASWRSSPSGRSSRRRGSAVPTSPSPSTACRRNDAAK